MPTPATALPQDPGASRHPLLRRPAGPLVRLLQLALGLAMLYGVCWAVLEGAYWWSGPTLRGAQTLGESLKPWTRDPDVQQAIARLGVGEIYTYDQLQEAAEALRQEEGERLWSEWLRGAFGLALWALGVVMGHEAWRLYWLSRPTRPIASPVGILDEQRVFVPQALPFPVLDHCPLATLRPPPEWLATTTPQTALARGLLECYAAHPEWPAAPSADPSVSGTTQQEHPSDVRLLDHALAVRARAMTLAAHRDLPPDLVELVALGHDLGKLATFRREGPDYVRLHPHHDRMSALLLATFPEWDSLQPADQEDLALAVAFHHRRDRLPARATPQARALLELLAEADETVRFEESHPETGQGASPGAERAGEPSVAAALGKEESAIPAVAPSDLQQRLRHVVAGVFPGLQINTRPFHGRTDPSGEFAMVLGSALLAEVAGELLPSERVALGLPADGGPEGLPAPTHRLPHPSSAAITEALRQLGWLIDSWEGQSATLWQVKVGRRIWPVCWLLRAEAWPAEVISGWPAPNFPLEVLGPAETSIAGKHDLVITSPESPDAEGETAPPTGTREPGGDS